MSDNRMEHCSVCKELLDVALMWKTPFIGDLKLCKNCYLKIEADIQKEIKKKEEN